MQSPDALKQFIERVSDFLGVPCDVACAEQSGVLCVTISAPDGGNVLIGRGGRNLAALEHITRAAWARTGSKDLRVAIDVNEYRQTKTKAAIDEAHEVADRVRLTRKAEVLSPMGPAERRVVHTELAGYRDLVTESTGVEPTRRVVVKPA